MRKSIVLILLAALMVLPSCMTTRTSTNGFNEAQGKEYYFDRGKQCYLFWGLLPLGRRQLEVPKNKQPIQVRTRMGFIDGLCTTLTAGIFSMQTIRIVAKRTADLKVGDKVNYRKGKKTYQGTIDSIVNEKKCVVKTADGKLKKMKVELVYK